MREGAGRIRCAGGPHPAQELEPAAHLVVEAHGTDEIPAALGVRRQQSLQPAQRFVIRPAIEPGIDQGGGLSAVAHGGPASRRSTQARRKARERERATAIALAVRPSRSPMAAGVSPDS